MQLALQRSQSPGAFGRVQFGLWAKFESTPEETTLIDKYKVRSALIEEGNTWRDVKRAALYAALITAVLTPLTWGTQLSIGMLLTTVFPIATYLIYQRIRERISIQDIINGKRFACWSVIALIEKEETVTKMAVAFRRFLESMKDWGGKEVIDIQPDREPTLRVIEPPHAAE